MQYQAKTKKSILMNSALRHPLLWLMGFFIWANPSYGQTTTWKGAFDNIKDMGQSGTEVLNMVAVLIGSGMAIFGWVGLTSESKRQRQGVSGSLMLIFVGALLIVWRVVVKTNVGQVFGEDTEVLFLD
ncbi:MAG: hypothetical protein AAF197_06075 [Pseudomonadota bacterium]